MTECVEYPHQFTDHPGPKNVLRAAADIQVLLPGFLNDNSVSICVINCPENTDAYLQLGHVHTKNNRIESRNFAQTQ